MRFNDFIVRIEEKGVYIIDEFDYPNDNILLVFKIPTIYLKDFKLILEGKYSKVSNTYKNSFPNTITINKKPISCIQHLVCNKTEELKQEFEEFLGITFDQTQEYWSIYNKQKETFKNATKN